MNLKFSRDWCLVLFILSNDIFSNHAVNAIRGGSYDHDNKFNYQVSVQKERDNGQYGHACGGSITGEKTILTAAHCFVSKEGRIWDPTKGTRIVAGTSDLNEGGIVRYIAKVYISKNYGHEDGLTINDIAVVELQESLFTDSTSIHQPDIQIIPLFETLDRTKLENQPAIVSGFGITKPKATSTSDIRKYLEVKITKERGCPNLSGIVCIFIEHLGTLGPQNVCSGDSGGPAVVDGKLVGVMSTAGTVKCDLSSKVGKLTFVPQYLDFIKRATDGSSDKGDIVILPDMKKKAEDLFKPAVL